MAAPTGADAEKMRGLWATTSDQVKKVAFSPTLYRALDITVAVAWEDNFFIIGYPAGSEGQLASILNTGENSAVIERTLQNASGDRGLRLRIIEGTAYTDWEHTKSRDAAALASRQQSIQKRTVESSTAGSWDEVYDQVSRLWANAEYRALPTGRGRYFDNAMTIVLDAMANGLYPAEGKADEVVERSLSRVIERIASMTSSDAAFIAYLLFERRKTAAKG